MARNGDRPPQTKKREKAEKPRTNGVSAAAIGEHLDISRQRVGQFTQEGVFALNEAGKLDLDACRLAYIRWLRGANRRGSKAASENAFREARVREIEQRIAKEDGRLIAIEDVAAGVTDIMGALRAELSGVAAASTRDLALREAIEGHLNGAIERSRRRFEEMGGSIRAGRGVPLDGEEADA